MQELDYIKSKVLDAAALQRTLALWRLKSKKIVFTNGCFDILHLGHIDYLAQAASLGNKMIVALNTDSSVSRIKGPNRPINDQLSRSMVMAALEFVSAVTFFDEPTPYE